MRILFKKLDGSLDVETIYNCFFSEDKDTTHSYWMGMDDAIFVVEGLTQEEHNKLAMELFQSGKVDLSRFNVSILSEEE